MNPNYKIKYGDTLAGIAKAQGTSVSELLRLNPSIKDPNRISAGASLVVSGTPTPYMPPVKENTSTAGTIAERAAAIPDIDPADKARLKALEDSLTTLGGTQTETKDEKTLREEARARINAQLSAARAAAALKKAEVFKEAEGTKGSARAMSARAGLLGTSFATTEQEEIDKRARDLAATYDAEVAAKEALLEGGLEADVLAGIENQRKRIKEGIDSYVTALQTRDSAKKDIGSKVAKALIAAGVDIEKLSDEDLKKLQDQYGMSATALRSLIEDEKNKVNKDLFFELSGGESRFKYDPITGKAVEIASKAKEATPKTGGAGDGMSGGGSGAFTTDLDALISNVATGISAKNQRDQFYSTIGRARTDSDKINAIASALKITGPSREDLTQTQVGQNNLRQAINMLNNGVKTGVVTAGTDYAFNLFGGQVDPKLTQLKQLIVAAIQPYRSSVTGAAWGQQEEAEYRSMFGSAKDNPATLLTKLQNLDRIMTNKRVGIIASYADPMGTSGVFDSYYSQGEVPAETPATDMVKMRNSKTGEVRNVPQASVSKALQAGYIKI